MLGLGQPRFRIEEEELDSTLELDTLLLDMKTDTVAADMPLQARHTDIEPERGAHRDVDGVDAHQDQLIGSHIQCCNTSPAQQWPRLQK